MSFTPIGGSFPTSSFTPLSATPPVAPQTTAQPSLFSKIAGAVASPFVQIGQTIGSEFTNLVQGAKTGYQNAAAQTAPKSLSSLNPWNPQQPVLSAGAKNLTDAFQQGGDQLQTLLTAQGNPKATPLDRGVAVANYGFGILNDAFTAFSAPLAALSSVPGVGQVADKVNELFGAIQGGVTGVVTKNMVQSLPLSQDTKDKIAPIASQLATLVVLAKAGEVSSEVFDQVINHTKEITKAISDDPTIVAHESAAPTVGNEINARPSEVPVSSSEPAAESQVATSESVATLPADQLISHEGAPDTARVAQFKADIQAGKPIEPLKVIPEGSKFGIEDGKHRFQALQDLGVKDIPVQVSKVKEPASTLPTNLTGVSKIGKSIEVKAVEAKLTQGFDKTAGFDKITVKDQAEKATNLVNTSLEDARAVVRGDKPLPEGLRGSALVTAVERYLVEHPDAAVAHELANSPLVSETSAAAQEMRLMAERVPDSITAKFKEIKAAREAALEKKGGLKKTTKTVTDDIRKEIKSTVSKRPTWEEFAKELACNY